MSIVCLHLKRPDTSPPLDVLKFISKRERNEGKVTKNKKGRSSSKKSSDQPKSRSIDQINRMLLDIADNKCPTGKAVSVCVPFLQPFSLRWGRHSGLASAGPEIAGAVTLRQL